MSFLRSLPFIPWQTPEFSVEDQARLDDYNKQIDAYSKAVDDYNAYIEKWNAGPRESDPTMKPPAELPFTQATLDTFSEDASKRAQDVAAQRELALAVAANPEAYNLSGFGFADGGSVSRQAFNKMFPQKFVVGGAALAAQNAAALAVPPAAAGQEQMDPSVAQRIWDYITGETAAREAETEAYLSQPIDNAPTQRLDPAAYAAALRDVQRPTVQESRISGGTIAPDADEREKTRRQIEALSRPGGFAPATALPPTPGFQPPVIDASPAGFPEAPPMPTALPGAEPQQENIDDFIMRILDAAPAKTQLEAGQRERELSAEDKTPEEIEETIWKELGVWRYGDMWLEELPGTAAFKDPSEWSRRNADLGQRILETTTLTFDESGNEDMPVNAYIRDKETNSILSIGTGKTKEEASTEAFGQVMREQPEYDAGPLAYQQGRKAAQYPLKDVVTGYEDLFSRYPEVARQYVNLHPQTVIPGTESTRGRFTGVAYEAMRGERPNFAPVQIGKVVTEDGGTAEIVTPQSFAAYSIASEPDKMLPSADVLEHEVQHSVFRELGLPSGYSGKAAEQLLTFYVRPRIMELRDGAEPKYEGEMEDLMKTANIATDYQTSLQELVGLPNPHAVYLATQGELPARLAQFRLGMTAEQKAAESPGATLRGQDYRAEMMKQHGFETGPAALLPFEKLVPQRVIEEANLELEDRMKNWGRTDEFIAENATARNALDAFTPKAIEYAERDSRRKSREVVVEMNIDDFLNLARKGRDKDKEEALKDVDQFDQIPHLSTEGEQVVGHEGRHRARRMKELGYTTMPVRIIDEKVRWGENPDVRFDTLKAESGDFSIEHPVKPGEYGAYWNQPVKTTAAERATEQGFTQDVFHGMHGEVEGDVFDPNMLDIGLHVGTAEQAYNRLRDLYDPHSKGSRYKNKVKEGANILPLKARMENALEMEDVGDWRDSAMVLRALWDNDLIQREDLVDMYEDAKALKPEFSDMENWLESPENRSLLDDINYMLRENYGYDTVKYKNKVEGERGAEHEYSYILLDPERDVRSRFAEFSRGKAREPGLGMANGGEVTKFARSTLSKKK